MQGRLIAVANMKGGVGKTTTVVSLAEALAAESGASVLVVDLDPQSNASVCLAGDHLLAELIRGGKTLDAFLAQRMISGDKTKITSKIRENVSIVSAGGAPLRLALLPSGADLRLVEREILYELTEKQFTLPQIDAKLTRLFETDFSPLADIFDYVLFDCAPGISPVTEAAIRVCDLVIVPTVADFMSLYGLDTFYESLWVRVPRGLLAPRSPPYVLVTRWQGNVSQQKQELLKLQREAVTPGTWLRLFDTKVPQTVALATALTKIDQPMTFSAKYGDLAGSVLQPLVAEVKEAVHGA